MPSAVSREFRLRMKGYGLTTAEIHYHLPDHPSLLQLYVWQDYDLAPDFPALKGFLGFWERELVGPFTPCASPTTGSSARRNGGLSTGSLRSIEDRHGGRPRPPCRWPPSMNACACGCRVRLFAT